MEKSIRMKLLNSLSKEELIEYLIFYIPQGSNIQSRDDRSIDAKTARELQQIAVRAKYPDVFNDIREAASKGGNYIMVCRERGDMTELGCMGFSVSASASSDISSMMWAIEW